MHQLNIRILSVIAIVVTVSLDASESKLDVKSKYSEDINHKSEDPSTNTGGKFSHYQSLDRPFRTNKLNLLWQKASKKYDRDDPTLQHLLRDFLNHDKLEIDLKRKKSSGKDETGEYEAIVREKMFDMLETYGLGNFNFVDEEETLQNESLDKSDMNDNFVMRDSRLGKIWKKAQGAGFSDDELKELKVELMHQQRKINEYNLLKHEIARLDNSDENSLDRFKVPEEIEQTLTKKKNDLKNKHREMKEGIQFLEASAQKVREQSPDFNDPRVVDLWLNIRKGNFTDEEIDGFKEELKHFERKIEKHRYLKQEVETMKSDKQNVEAGRVKIDKQEKLNKKVDEYDRQVKKMYSSIKNRVDFAERHSEL